MGAVLIVTWLAVNQSYMRDTQHYPQMQMQEFKSMESCQNAAKIVNGFGYKTVKAVCVTG